MAKNLKKRGIDQEFVTPTTLDQMCEQIEDAAGRVLTYREFAEEYASLALALMDAFLLLCSKWLKSPYINSIDKEKIRDIQPKVADLHLSVFSKMQMMERKGNWPRPEMWLPQTSEQETVTQLESLGIQNAYISEEELPPPLDFLYEKVLSPRILVEIADREQPILGFRLPTVNDRRLAEEFERVGYRNSFDY